MRVAAAPDMEEGSRYQHTPLPGPGWIRLLTIQPHIQSWNQDPIICDISHHLIKKDDDYIALSYTWAMPDGNSKKSRTIHVNGLRIRVSRNLFEAIQRIRTFKSGVPIWIDAVCIDQEQIEERNGQVAQMSRIYASAKEVIAWLGEEDLGRARAVFACFGSKTSDARCGDSHKFVASDGRVLDLCDVRRTRICLTDPNWRQGRRIAPNFYDHAANQQAYIADLANVVRVITKSRYFTRRWVIQEIYHARSVEFGLGSDRVPMDVVAECHRNLLQLIQKHFFGHPPLKAALELTQVALRVLEVPQKGKQVQLHELVAETVATGCSDPRDIIFALTSLCPDAGITPDYTMYTAEVFTAFSCNLVNQGRIGLLLENLQACRLSRSRALAVQNHADGDDLIGLPSWTLDLRLGFKNSPKQPRQDYWDDLKPNDFWNSSFIPPPYSYPDVQLQTDNSLVCKVYLVGRVAEITDYGFRVIDSTIYGSVKVHFSTAPLASRNDFVVAIDQDDNGPNCYNVMVLRRADEEDSFRLLHWAIKAILEIPTSMYPPRAERKALIRIV